jgi:PAS domain S-box-containing protein
LFSTPITRGYEWSDREIEGLLAGLQAVHPGISPAIEHLDLKRFSGEDFENRLRGFLSDKYRNQKTDLAVILDNPAVDLILSHRDEILPGVPVVFAGVSNFTPDMLKGQNRITGVAEGQDHQGTLSLALGLHPGTRRVLAVHDYTATGRAVRREMEAVLPAFRDRVQVNFNAPATYEEMVAQIAGLPPDSLVLILSFVTDSAGKALTPSQGTAVLTAKARVPVYAVHDTRLGQGIVGGMLIGGAEHGRRAAALALRVLAGEDPASIPVETQGTARPMFDYVQLQRFDIPLDALPAGAVLVNRPVSFYEEHKNFVWGVAGIIGLLLVMVGCLLLSLQRKDRAERALQESEERYRQVVEIVPDSISMFVEERFAFINPSAMKLLGAESSEQVIGRQIWDFCLPTYRSLGEGRFRQCQDEGQALPPAEFELIRLDGQVRTVESAAAPITFKGRRAVLAAWRDITTRKQAEKALQESEARFRLLYEKAPMPYQSLDEAGNFVEVNQAFLDALGYSREEVIGRNFSEFLAADWGDHFKQNFPRFKSIGEILGVEFEMVKKDGTAILVSFNGRIAKDSQGRFKQTHCIFTDITERRRVAEALSDSEERHRKIVEASSDAFLLRSGEIVIYANPAALKLFRANHPEELIGKRYLDLVHPDDRPLSVERMKKNLDENWIATPREHRILALDGQVVHVESTGVSVKHRGENQLFGVFRDITERKRVDQEKEKLEGQLRQAQKMEAIGTLAGGIAHDFNNILSVIVGNAEILEFSKSVDEPSRGGLGQILAASQRAKQLVRQILAFSRHGTQEKIFIDPKPIVKETLEFLRASLPTSIQLRHYLEPDTGTIMADPTQLQQVLMNLCTNAGHSMEKDGGVLQIKLSNAAVTEEDARSDPEVEPGNYVKIIVSDTGHGMEPSVLERIFDPYFTTKEPGKGTGLGLAVVHGIVKSHGGMIKVSSEVGQGTTSTIFLPRAVGFEKVEDKPMPPLSMGTEKILFVDDEEALADLGRHMLGELGYQVETRTSPIEALEAFRANPQKFDLVITDLTMPQLTGLKLARKLMEIRPDIPIILCTGFSEQASEKAAVAIGIRAFLFKPLLMRDIAGAVRKVLDECNAKNS